MFTGENTIVSLALATAYACMTLPRENVRSAALANFASMGVSSQLARIVAGLASVSTG